MAVKGLSSPYPWLRFMNSADLCSTGETRYKIDEGPPHDSWSSSTVQGGEQSHSKAASEWVGYYASVEVADQHHTRSECEIPRHCTLFAPVFLRPLLVRLH